MSKTKREPDKLRFRFMERDFNILLKMDEYRYLVPSQVKRLFFPESTTLQSTNRRLKYLFHSGYLGKIEPFVQASNGAQPFAYFLDKKGRDVLSAHGHEPRNAPKRNKAKHLFLQHALDLSEFRIHLEQGLITFPAIEQKFFIADFEKKTKTHPNMGRHQYRVYEKLTLNPQKQYDMYPDGVFVLSTTHRGELHEKLYFLEVDRGTEGMNVLQDKVIAYNLYFEQKKYLRYGVDKPFRVLIQTDSAKRRDRIINAIAPLQGSALVFVSDRHDISAESLLSGEVWVDTHHKKRALLRT